MTHGKFATLRAAGRKFTHASDASTLIIFALALIPVMGLVGAAIDYSRASSLRSAMQSVSDAAALAIAAGAPGMTADQLNSAANTYFRPVFSRLDAQALQVTATYSAADNTVVVNATAGVKTQIMGVLGFRTLPDRADRRETARELRRNREQAVVEKVGGRVLDRRDLRKSLHAIRSPSTRTASRSIRFAPE